MLKIPTNSGRSAKRWMRLAGAMVLFAAAACAQSSGAAQIVSMKGQVSVLRGPSPWILAEGEFIKPQETVRTGPDGMATLKMTDGSTVDVYPNSQFTFRNNPGNLEDLVDVILGKIKVKIEHFGNVPNHNTVRTPTAVIAVRGTIFDVDVSGLDETTTVTCDEGRVEVYHASMPGGKSRILDPGESITVFKNQPLAKSTVDRGAVFQKAVRAMSDAVDQILMHRASGGAGPISGTTTTSTGDKGGTPAPVGGTPAPPPPHN